MRLIVISKKSVIIAIIIFTIILLSLLLFKDISYKVLETIAPNKLVPIYCVDTEEKKIAISFDAAWGDRYTQGILDILDKYNIKSTFFLVGFWVDRYPDMVREINKRGHDIGNHSSTHPHMSKLSKEQIVKELNQTGDKINNLTGEKPYLFRPPFGDYNNNLIKTAKECGYYTIQWDVDSLDWKELGVEPVVDRVTRNVKNGSIVLFHNNAKYILDFLPLIIEKLQKEGYQIVPISEIIMKDNYYIDHTGKQKKLDNNNKE
ncbi:polysaccharide deacetylase family sporulation protein PdaB [Paramaledivibacter caminithermalis]|jgi:polysaccharide deacetylase family sporulation protein PdaB|uniref:Polysaccharide deacetylase family sporulation protein PdaB n=1 Tax=Paramaledivibacter caminithermalis (strain DSM 15212 / CIP 107654 / DViRD3) TaxID=1121301 RepID=A0A1M6LCK6_PARC5|nr:polysaccharide deacetylase family sporulation protein PdaB [Paramaledivibacter caminithermalis]SHJ68923.1 polysaccharide deacetylase family sporulation protein PdaB [Paramaledivibacter caminithermalis DSM 15212]